MQIVFLDLASVDNGDLDLMVLKRVPGNWFLHHDTDAARVCERIATADVVISNKVVLNETELQAAPDLRLICVAATGTNNIDLLAAQRRHISVCNVRRYATASVVQHVFALILMLVRQLPAYQRAVAEGAWQRSAHFCLLDFPIEELTGKVLGIVGYGELGQAVARVAEAMGMTVRVAQRLHAAPLPGRIPLHDLLPQIDILSLHCPLSPSSRQLIGDAQLARLRRGALVINTARGGLIDEVALLHYLRNGHLGGAGIDVLASEPPEATSPLLQASLPNLIVTPHIAWASRQARQRVLNGIAEIILAYQQDRLINQVLP